MTVNEYTSIVLSAIKNNPLGYFLGKFMLFTLYMVSQCFSCCQLLRSWLFKEYIYCPLTRATGQLLRSWLFKEWIYCPLTRAAGQWGISKG
jgi:hypothetical protein